MSLPIRNEACASCGWFVPICTLTSGVLNLHCILQMPTSKDLQNTECSPVYSWIICLSGTFFLCRIMAILPEKGFESSPQPTNTVLPTSSLTAWLRHRQGPLQSLWSQSPPTTTSQTQAKRTSSLGFCCVLFLLPHNTKVPAQRWKNYIKRPRFAFTGYWFFSTNTIGRVVTVFVWSWYFWRDSGLSLPPLVKLFRRFSEIG